MPDTTPTQPPTIVRFVPFIVCERCGLPTDKRAPGGGCVCGERDAVEAVSEDADG